MIPLALNLLETLPGWPAVHEPSVMDFLFLILFLPLAIAAVFAAIILGPGWYRKNQG